MKQFPILYKRSNSGDKINQWSVTVDNNTFYTTSGFVGMKLFTGEPTKCIPKNEGKKNSTTAEQQALAEATALHRKRKEAGYWEDINDCDKKVFFAPMLAHEYKERLAKGKITYPFGSSFKLDGVRCESKVEGLYSRNGKPIISAPHIYKMLQPLFNEYPDLILDGELYADKEICDFNTIISCVRTQKPTLDDLALSREFISYHVYDIAYIDEIDRTYVERVKLLKTLVDKINNPQFVFVDYEIVNNDVEVKAKLAEYIELGYEGQMLRVLDSFYESKRSNNLLKHKTFFDDEFEVVGYEEGKGKFAGKLAKFIIKLPNGETCKATSNGNMKYLEGLWRDRDTFIGKQVTVKYFEKTPSIYDDSGNIIGGDSLRFPKVIAIRDYE
jgi:ATP-dependent DNA ligase